jgi:hypothetical protein
MTHNLYSAYSMMSQGLTPSTCALSCYAPPSSILLCLLTQLSSHFVHMNTGSDAYMTTFTSGRYLGIYDKGGRSVEAVQE